MLPERAACRKVPKKAETLNVSGKFHKAFGTLIMIAGVHLPSLANNLSLPECSSKSRKQMYRGVFLSYVRELYTYTE